MCLACLLFYISTPHTHTHRHNNIKNNPSINQSDLKKGLFATEVGTMRSPATVAAVFDRVQTLTAAMRRWVGR